MRAESAAMGIRDLVTFVWRHPLNAPQRAAALARVARWQLASHVLGMPVAVPFVDGTSLLVSKGMKGATGNWYCGLHDFRDMAFVLHFLRPTDRFLDVGANVGSYTILAGATGASVTSVEPIPQTVEHLRRNVALNNLGARVRIEQCGLSDRIDSRRFSSDEDTTNHVLLDDEVSTSAVSIPMQTLDGIVGDDVPALIKIDVEGHEAAVLRGANRTLQDKRLLAVITEMNDSGDRHGRGNGHLSALMRVNGFAPFSYDPFARTLVDPSHADANVVFVKDKAAVEERVRTSRRYHLINGDI